MRSTLAACVLTLSLAACGSTKGGGGDTDGGNGKPDACVGLQCQIVDCSPTGQPPTSLSGTVFAPNGTLPLYGITVYIPLGDPGPVSDTLACDRCSSTLPGGAVAQATSGEDGTFTLENVPVGDNIPLIITSGKWRRQITIPRVEQCVDTPLVAAQTALPKNKAEGDIPKIAVTTGNADSMECLARKLGIEDSEISTNAGAGRIHLYAGNGVNKFVSGFPGGSAQSFGGAEPFWSSADALKAYDIVILSCEGSQLGGTAKSQGALDAMKAYADAGGRVFASHWHNIWISGKFQNGVGAPTPAVWDSIATWESRTDYNGLEVIDEAANPKGQAFANWMVNVMASTTRGEFPVTQGKVTSVSLDQTKAERWVYTKGAGMTPQMFQFTTPNEVVPDQRCGKVVFTDMHVSGSRMSGDFPNSCVGGASNLSLTPQEKALAFMFFDIASCVGGIF